MINEYVYTEYGSKNNQGGFSSLNLSNKIVHQYEIDSERCHVKILDLYLQKLPPDAKDKDAFYFRPLPDVPSNPSNAWFTSIPVGKNMLNTMLNKCVERLEYLSILQIIVFEHMEQPSYFRQECLKN